MRGERLILAGSSTMPKEGTKRILSTMPEDEHKVVAEISEPLDVIPLMDQMDGVDAPTTAIVYEYPTIMATVSMVYAIKIALPGVKIVTWGVDQTVDNEDRRLGMHATRDDLKEMLLSVEH